MKNLTTQQETLEKIISTISPSFLNKGFNLKQKRFFERKNNVVGNIDQYEIRLAKTKNYFSLNLILHVLNKEIMDDYNRIMKKVLLDDQYIYPDNWAKKDIEHSIKVATSEIKLFSLANWNELGDDKIIGEEFNIWLCVFDFIEQINDWKNQLLYSVEICQKWFLKVENIDYIISNTDIKALYLLKKQGDLDRLIKKYNEILSFKLKNKISTNELQLFYKHLMNS